MKLTKKFSVFAVALNFYMLGGWIYVYNKYPVQQLRVNAFKELFGGLNLSVINLFVIVVTIISLIFATWYKPKFIGFIVMSIHIITLAYILWTHL